MGLNEILVLVRMQVVNYVLDLLCAAIVADKQCIVGIYDHHIMDAYNGNQAFAGMHKRATSIVHNNIPPEHITVPVFITQIVDRPPVANVAPPKISRERRKRCWPVP